MLVARGADLEVEDGNGWTPLHLASQYGHDAVAVALLARGADASHVPAASARRKTCMRTIF